MSSQFISRVSFVSKISVLMKATSDDDKPIPGYVLNEVSKISLESDENCETLVDFLVDRLERDSTHVKIKVLKLMKYVVENGHPNFRLALLKKSTGIKEATKYSGPADPLHGNVPYLMVRKTAESLSEMLFNMDTANVGDKPLQNSHISTYGIGSSGQGKRKSKMEGFGNTAIAPGSKSLGESIKDGIFNLVEQLGETTVNQQRDILSEIGTNTGYVAPRDSRSHGVSHDIPAYTQEQVVTDIPKRQASPKHVPGKAGGGWDDSDDDVTDYISNDVTDDVTSDKQTTKSDTSSCSGNVERLSNIAFQEFTAEQNLISSYIDNTDTGAPVLLKRCQLKSFLKECSNLNCDKVVEFLNVKLSTSEEQNVMRSLMLLETMMNSDLVNLDRLCAVCKDGLVAVVTNKSGQLKSKSKKLIRILEKLSSHQQILIDDQQITDLSS